MDRTPGTLVILVAVGLAAAQAAGAATIVVDSTADDATAGNCSLREAIVAANTNAAVDGCLAGEPGPGVVDVVSVPAGVYVLALGPRGDDDGLHGDLDLTDDVEVRGAGAGATHVDGGDLDRVFHVHGGVAAEIADLEIRGGDAGGGNGGGVNNSGDLILVRVAVTGNRAGGSGGGIRNNSQLTVQSSLLFDNLTDDHGGGIDNHGDAAFENTTVSGNDGGNLGGGLYNLGGVSLVMTHVTVVGNTAGGGDAVHNAGDLTAANNLIAGPCSGTVTTTGGGNLESPGDTCGLGPDDLPGVADPRLGALADNGGGTATHALLAGSPAIDVALAASCPAADQRGTARPIDGDGDSQADCDAGAFEAEGGEEEGLIFQDGFESGDASRWS